MPLHLPHRIRWKFRRCFLKPQMVVVRFVAWHSRASNFSRSLFPPFRTPATKVFVVWHRSSSSSIPPHALCMFPAPTSSFSRFCTFLNIEFTRVFCSLFSQPLSLCSCSTFPSNGTYPMGNFLNFDSWSEKQVTRISVSGLRCSSVSQGDKKSIALSSICL